MKKSKIAKMLDVSDEFWKQFEMYHKSTKKVMGPYKIENIDNQNIVQLRLIRESILRNLKIEK